MKMGTEKRRTYYIVISLLLIVLFVLISCFSHENASQLKAIGVLLAALILWVSNSLPMSITTLVMVFLLPVLKLMPYDEVINHFGIGTSIFIMASSGITVAISKSTIPYMITEKVFFKLGKHPIMMIYTFGICIALLSGFISSLAVCALFTSLVSAALSNVNAVCKKTNLSKALMICVPACSGIGGFISPAGTPANMLVLDILNENGIELSFGKWCAIGLPVGIIATIIFLTFLVVNIRPEKIESGSVLPQKTFEKADIIVMITVGFIIVGWFLSGFIPELNITLVAVIGLSFLFIPSLKILSFDKFSNGVNWDMVLTMGSVSVLMIAIANTGLISRLTNIFAPLLSVENIYVLLFILSILICIIRAFVPTTTAVIALLVPMLMNISCVSDIDCGVLLLIASFWAAAALLIVYTEPIYLISYKEGYYKQSDLIKVGLPSNILIAMVCPVLIYIFY